MNPTFLALGAVFLAIGAGTLTGARKRPAAEGGRTQSIAAGLMFAAGIALIVAASLSRPV